MSASDPLEFLGEEFLTWLWFCIETRGGDFDLPGDRAVGVSFDDFLAFAPRDDDETEHTLKKGTPSRSAEASTALRSGHRLLELHLESLCLLKGRIALALEVQAAALRPLGGLK